MAAGSLNSVLPKKQLSNIGKIKKKIANLAITEINKMKKSDL
jgi:hypothetical protein